MNPSKLLQNIQSGWSPLAVIAVTTLAIIAVSIHCLASGYFIIFQNLFYIPIIIACSYYTKRGFAFSVIIASLYFLLTLAFTRESSILLQAFVRVLIFVLVAGVITYLSLACKRAEDSLVAERTLLRTLIDHLPDTIYVKDAACRKTLANPVDVRNIGASSEAEVLGKTDFDFYPHELAAAFYADDQSVIQSGRPMLNREEMITLPDRTIGWQVTSKVPLRDSTSQVIGLIGIGHDITERKRAEQERESLIEELKTALENVRTLDGLVPICAHCKKIRDDKGYWNQLEKYIVEHTDAKLTHGLCPDCAELYFPGFAPKT
jgi:PAS domain S-box-containing protein